MLSLLRCHFKIAYSWGTIEPTCLSRLNLYSIGWGIKSISYNSVQEFKISELEKEVKEGEKRDAVDSADTRAAQRDLRRLQVLLGFRGNYFSCEIFLKMQRIIFLRWFVNFTDFNFGNNISVGKFEGKHFLRKWKVNCATTIARWQHFKRKIHRYRTGTVRILPQLFFVAAKSS